MFVNCVDDFIYENVNVVGEIDNLSDQPDFAMVRITGGQTVLQHFEDLQEIATFPSCMTVLKITSTIDAYEVSVFVNDPSKVNESTFHIKSGILRAYWGSRMNMEKDVSFTVKSTHTSTSTLSLWPLSNTIYTSSPEFSYSLSSLFVNDCQVDETSFATSNVRIISVTSSTLMGTLINATLPGSITFLGYQANTCSMINYPEEKTVMVVMITLPTYSIAHTISTPGCSSIHVDFSAPVISSSTNYLAIESTNNLPYELQTTVTEVGYNQFIAIDGSLCISGDSDTLSILIHPDVTSLAGNSLEPIDYSIYISKVSMILALSNEGLPSATHNETYIMREKSFQLTFNVLGSNPIDSCDFSHAFTSDYLVALTTNTINGKVTVDVTANSIDHHIISFDSSKIHCDGSFSIEFIPSQFKFAYDPAFLPGDIIITRINSYYSPEFDFIPLRKVYTWNRIFFTDAGWVNEVYGFVDHGSDGYISWTPKTDVEAGTVQQWSYVAMTQSLDRSIPKEVDMDYSFNYEMHGFLLDFQDNLFIYVTGNGDSSSQYDDYNHMTFIFGVYWSSSEWAEQTYDYMDITAEYSSLPLQLSGYSIALGTQATPVPRGVNYMAIKQANFNTFSNSYYHMIEKIVNKDNWVTSQKDRFTTSPLVSYIERPMDFIMTSNMDSSIASYCFAFTTPFTISIHSNKITLKMEDKVLPYSFSIMDGKYCIRFTRPSNQGMLSLHLEQGAFTYTTSSTLTPYTFESVAYDTTSMIYNTPILSIQVTNDAYQFIEISSSLPCSSWNEVEFINAQARLVNRSTDSSIYAVMLTGNFNMILPEGVCITEGTLKSTPITTTSILYTPIPVTDAFLTEVHFEYLKDNSGDNTVFMKYPANWELDDSLLPRLAGEEVLYYTYRLYSHTIFFTFNSTITEGELVIPSGFFYKNVHRSIGVHHMYFDFNNSAVNVMNHLELPWTESITYETIRNAVFQLDFAPATGSSLPNELLQFTNQCRSLGYIMGPTVDTSIPVAIMHGECTYSIIANKMYDSYGNTNEAYEDSKIFDFLPPVGSLFLTDEIDSMNIQIDRYYWNVEPIVGITFNEKISNLNEEPILLTSTNCEIIFDSIESNTHTIIYYQMMNCTDGEVIVSLIPDIQFKDESDNACMSQDCIAITSIQFEMDRVIPQITLSTENSIIYGNSFDLHYEISEPMTTFSCSSIGIAVQQVRVEVTELPGSICHYAFTPKPVNGTYIVLYVPENRFVDKALNGNMASNTLLPLVLNEGAIITVTAPTYTNHIQTEFTIAIGYTWLCPNYEQIFPSTFEYDRDIARIEKTGESVIVDGVINQSFTITFLNFETYPEDRYKQIPIYIPSMVCTNSYGLYNEPVTFFISFDNTPTEPSFSLTPDIEHDSVFNIMITFEDMKEFGTGEPSSYVSIGFDEEEPIQCTISRSHHNNIFSYLASCPITSEGNLNVTIHRGALIENTGVPSSMFTRIMYVDAYPPEITLATVNNATTFGPSITTLPIQITVSEIMSALSENCFVFENTDGLTVSVNLNAVPVTSNQLISLQMINTHVADGLISGSFNMYIREGCVHDIHQNKNLESNHLTFYYDFTAPTAVLTCPTENIVLNTITFTGTMSKPCQDLTPANIQVSSSCSIRELTMLSSTSFEATLSCYDTGSFEYSLVNYKDLVGNIGIQSNRCSTSFTIYGPTIQYTIQDLIKEEYVNQKRFTIELSAAPNCYSMNLTFASYVTENVKNIQTLQKSACVWELSGENIEEGLVVIRILEGAAVDIYGGPSLSRFIEFRSYQSYPTIINVTPSLVSANENNKVSICYDRAITRGEGSIRTEGACNNAIISTMSSYCIDVDVTVTVGTRCYLYLEDDFVQTIWELGSAGRYVFLEIDSEPPTIDMTMIVNEQEINAQFNTAELTTKSFYINANGQLMIEVPHNMEVHLTQLSYPTSSCIESIEVEQQENIEISIAFKEVQQCSITFSFATGFFIDAFGRSSLPLNVIVDYNTIPAIAVMSTIEGASITPITQIIDFSKVVMLTEENIVSTIPFTLSHENHMRYSIAFTPANEGEYIVEFTNVHDIHGNALTSLQPLSFAYYTTQPTVTLDDTIIVSTLSGEATTITYAFNHQMATLPSTFTELYQCNDSLDTYFTLSSATVVNTIATVIIVPKEVSIEYKEFTCSLSSQGFVDIAGNNVTPTTFTLIIDNQAPVVSTITHQGVTQFSKLPVSITISFSKLVTLNENYESMVYGQYDDSTLSFHTFTRSSINSISEITLLSDSLSIELEPEHELIIMVDAGFATDANSLPTDAFNITLTVATGSIELSSIEDNEDNYGMKITMSRPITTVLLNEVTLVNAAIQSLRILSNTIEVEFTCAEQGPFSITFPAGSIIGSDDTVTQNAITYSGIYDTIAPSVVCTIPAVVGSSLVTIPCTFSKPVQTTSTFFTVERENVLLNTEETLSEDGLSLSLAFTPIESIIPEYSDNIIITLHSCKDMYHNECLPVRYETLIDFTRPIPTLQASRSYIKSNETVEIELSFNKPIQTTITQYLLTFNYPEESAMMTIDSFETLQAGLRYKWTVTFASLDFTYELIPFQVVFEENLVVDTIGNQNMDSAITIYIHELSPILIANLLETDDEKQQLTLNLTIMNGPVSSLTSSMLSLSDNLELLEIVALPTLETTSFYHLSFQLTCTQTCSYSVRFLSEMIFNVAGNQLEHDYSYDNMYVMYPVITLSSLSSYCSSSYCSFTITSSEPVDIACDATVVNVESVVISPSTCYNAMVCECTAEIRDNEWKGTLELQVPEGSYKSSYDIESLASPIYLIHYSASAAIPVFTTEWSEEDPLINIPFTVTPSVENVLLTPNMIKCYNCEIGNWQQLAASPISLYNFTVSFLSEDDMYIRVYIEKDTFIDPFGFMNEEGKYVIRKNSEVPVATRFSINSGRVTKMNIEFSRPVQACEGHIYITAKDLPDYSYSISVEDSNVVFKNRIVTISQSLLPNTEYTISWEETAICDESRQLASTECSMCSLVSAPTLPTPPMSVIVTDITSSSIHVNYSSIYTGSTPLRAIMVYTVPSIQDKPFVYETDQLEGEFEVTGFESNTKYTLYLASFTTNGISVLSPKTSFTTEASTPKPISHLRICNIENPISTSGLITYTQAEACWDASPSKNIRYKVVVTELINGNPGLKTVVYKGKETRAPFTVSNDIEHYQVTVFTITKKEVDEGVSDRVAVSEVFDTVIDLENLDKYPQGAGIEIAAERLSSNSVFIRFNHPYENYFAIDKYLVQYGNTFDDTFEPSGTHLESYEFRMDKCLGNYVTVTVRAGIHGDFWGVPSNRVIVYCKTPRYIIETTPGYNFVSFTVKSDVKSQAVCNLQGVYSTDIHETMKISINPTEPMESYLFKSLTPDTDYRIICEGYDIEYKPISGSTEFYTTSNFEQPQMIVNTIEESMIHSSYVSIPIASVNMPGYVYCIAKPLQEPLEFSRMQYIRFGASSYQYPGKLDNTVIVSGLEPGKEYHAQCIFDPDYSPSILVQPRRLVDEEILFTTPIASSSQWKHISPAGSIVVPLYQPLVFTASLPIAVHHGTILLRCLSNPALTKRVTTENSSIKIDKNVATVYMKKPLVAGQEYRIEMTLGMFLDEAGYPMPAITAEEQVIFITTKDERIIAEPTVLQTVPASGSVSDLVSMKVYYTFDREIQVAPGNYMVKVNDNEVHTFDSSTLEVKNNILTINNNLFFKPDSQVQIIIAKNMICSRFLSCNSKRIVLRFTIGKHAFEPSLISMFPVDGQKAVPAGEDIKLIFNKEIALQDDFVITFTNDYQQSIVLKYLDEKTKMNSSIRVVDNELIIKGSILPNGHHYYVLLNAEAVVDKEGRPARSVPASFTFTTSEYSCGGNYIAEQMADECSCFLTDSKCECWCGQSEDGKDVIIRKMH